MAITSTTLAAAVAINDLTINVASATGFGLGNTIRIDDELMLQTAAAVGTIIAVRRGVEGTKVAAHVSSAAVRTGLPFTATTGVSDFGVPSSAADPVALFPAQRPRRILSYSAAGAITLPNPGEDMVAVINGTSGLAMTLANPAALNDGDMLYIIANGKAAHTVTYTAGLGNGGTSFDVGTFSASLTMCAPLMACGGFWVSIGPSGATGIVGSPTWA